MAFGRRQYPFHLIEPKWQRHWQEKQTFRAWNPGEPIPPEHPFAERHPHGNAGSVEKYYILDMFPYPSGAGLHVGHPEGYTATDILARYQRARGRNVLHPMGWDAFGLPAEQYAIRTGQHPRKTTETNIATFKKQIQSLGFSYDWSREVDTTDPEYFKWTQWIFLKLYNSWFNPDSNKAEPIDSLKFPENVNTEPQRRAYRDARRLAYVHDAPVWWCAELGTVLANEEVVDGKSEVGGFPVTRKPMRQWLLRITAYAQRMLDDLETIEWSDSLKEMQRNWIGRSEGAEVDFPIQGSNEKLRVFTTRPDTLFGATYMVLAPEHGLVSRIVSPERAQDVRNYQAQVASKSDLERTEGTREKTGVFTGAYAINPVTNSPIPIWIADYVLAGYGTGAIMAVPAHDTRDFEFATKFNLPVVQVVAPPGGENWQGFTGDGLAVNSDGQDLSLNGLSTPNAKKKITSWLSQKGLGAKSINFKLRDWLFSRQRFWGEPFPIVWKKDAQGGAYHEALPETALPLLPPSLEDYKPTPDGQPPLARALDWVNLPDGSRRETNTMPQWAGSCWYYLRYLDSKNPAQFCNPKAESYWMGTLKDASANQKVVPGVDLYVGGTEHAVLHLLYARFWHKVLFDLGYVSTSEPFYKLVNQGLILGEDGQKMSKSRGNVINPDEILVEYGADAFRLYEMFMGPLEMTKPWNTKGVEGVYRFLGRVWRLIVDEAGETEFEQQSTVSASAAGAACDAITLHPSIIDRSLEPAEAKALHTCIKKVTEDLDGLRFNTGISALMVFINEAMTWKTKPIEAIRTFLILLQPFAPHLAEELYSKLPAEARAAAALAYAPWPSYNPALLVEDEIEIPIQVNGKLRDVLKVPTNISNADLEAAARTSAKVIQFLEGKTIRKVIVIPKKLVNFVVG